MSVNHGGPTPYPSGTLPTYLCQTSTSATDSGPMTSIDGPASLEYHSCFGCACRESRRVTSYVVSSGDHVLAAPTIPVSAEENLGDPIEIRVDVVHPVPVAAVAFPVATITRRLAQHGEAIRGIHEHLLGVSILEELTALRFRVDVAEAKNASLHSTIRTMEAIETVTRNHERLARIEIERQLALVHESHVRTKRTSKSSRSS
ncbi:hypothetical protein Tco_0524089 [Tanacetum coccineum]